MLYKQNVNVTGTRREEEKQNETRREEENRPKEFSR